MNDYEIKSCPFCGSEATLYWNGGKYGMFAVVECDMCDARGKTFGGVTGNPDDPDFWNQRPFKRAVLAWNRRVNE